MFEMTFEGIINGRLKSSNDRREWFLEIWDADQPLKFVSFIAIKLYYFTMSYSLYDMDILSDIKLIVEFEISILIFKNTSKD